jgi:hypothetical protein
MDSEIDRNPSIAGPEAVVRTNSQPFGDSRDHMGSILYPRVRPVRHRAHRSPQPPQPDATTAQTDPTQAATDETPDKACQSQPEAGQVPPNADKSLGAASLGSAATETGDTE